MFLCLVVLLLPLFYSPIALALECNICGPGTDNIIGKPQGVLTLNYDGVSRKQNCLKWQQGSFLDEEWCQINIMNYSVWPCGCLLADGSVLMDVLEKERQEADGGTLWELIDNYPELTLSRDALQTSGLVEMLDDLTQTFTVFAPSDNAVRSSRLMQFQGKLNVTAWNDHLKALVENHIVPSRKLFVFDIFRMTEVKTLQDTLQISQFTQKIGGASIEVSDVAASNGLLHIISSPLEPGNFNHSFADLEQQAEYGPDWMNRTSMVDVVDFVGARDVLNQMNVEGTTYAGCRIRAFNRMGLDYLPQTINGADSVISGELLNASMKEHTLKNFIEYHLIPGNLYLDSIPNGFQELVTPVAKCAHMWITKTNEKLCFNDACVVSTPYPRTYLGSNGVGYVVDKCPICPGIAMMTNYAAEYTFHNLRDVSQLFLGSEWNLRNLSSSLGNGSPFTLFAPINAGWDFFTLEDTTRLATDKWKRHLWDLLKHFLYQGDYSKDQLKQMVFDNGGKPLNLTMMTGEKVFLDYDASRNVVKLGPGDIYFSDVYGVDGVVHFVTQVPRPRSVSHTVYDMGKEREEFKIHMTYIDSLFLAEDLKRLLPLTVFYAPNEAFKGKVFEITEISESLLENMVFKELLWCERLVEMAGEHVASHNEQTWLISVNEAGFPCFDTLDVLGGTATKACVTHCDILARNGIMHELDTVMVYDDPRTKPPSTAPPTVEGSGSTPPAVPKTIEPNSSPVSGNTAVPHATLSPGTANPSYSTEGHPTSGTTTDSPTEGPTETSAVLPTSLPTVGTTLIVGGSGTPPPTVGSTGTAPPTVGNIQTVSPTLSTTTAEPTTDEGTAKATTNPTLVSNLTDPFPSATTTPVVETTPPTLASSAARTYEENGRKVKVYIKPLAGTENDNPSNKKCVEYVQGGTTELTTACFDTVFNVNGIYVDCMMYYNDVACTSCKPCVSADNDRIPGFNLDCNNILPSKTVLSTCPPLDDRTIQEYLTNDGHFSNTVFIFDSGENEGEKTNTAIPTFSGTTSIPVTGGTTAPTVESSETATPSEGGTGTISPTLGEGDGQETTKPPLTSNTTGPPLDDETFSNLTTFAPSLDNSTDNIFDRPNQQTTDPPLASNVTTTAPNATNPPLGNETTNTSTFAPSLDNSKGNTSGRPMQEDEEEAPFIQNASVVLKGLAQLLNDTEQETYIQTTQAFLRKRDPTAVVEFVAQKLIKVSFPWQRDGIRHLIERKMLSSALEVTTAVGSWEDESPGTSAANFIQSDSSIYVETLQQASDSFDQLQNVAAAGSPVTSPANSLSTPPKSKDKGKNTIIWCALGLLVLALMCALFFSFKYRKLAKQCPAKGSNENSCNKQLNKDDAMVDNTSEKDDARYRYDPNSWHHQDAGRYGYDQDEYQALGSPGPSERNTDSWTCEHGDSQRHQRRVSGNSFGDSSDSSDASDSWQSSNSSTSVENAERWYEE